MKKMKEAKKGAGVQSGLSEQSSVPSPEELGLTSKGKAQRPAGAKGSVGKHKWN